MGTLVKKYIWILSLLAVFAMSYLLARMTTLFIASYFPDEVFTSKGSSSSLSLFQGGGRKINVDAVIKRNFFDAEESSFDEIEVIDEPDEVEEVVVQTDGKAVKTSLDLLLISTVSFGNGEDRMSSCVIEVKKKTDVYGVNDVLPFPQTKLIRVLPKRIEFTNKGRLEYAEIPEEEVKTKPLETSSPRVATKETYTENDDEDSNENSSEDPVEQQGNHYKVKNSVVQAALKQPERLYTQIRAVPYFEDKKPAGFKFYKVNKGSIFHKLGIRRGDVVKSVNGRVLDIQSGMQTFAELKNLRNFELEVVRKGASQRYTYEIIDG